MSDNLRSKLNVIIMEMLKGFIKIKIALEIGRLQFLLKAILENAGKLAV